MAPSIAARRVDGVQGARSSQGSAGRGSAVCPKSPSFSTALLPPDEEYGRDRSTRCTAEMRPAARYGFRRLSMIIRFETETSALLTPRAA